MKRHVLTDAEVDEAHAMRAAGRSVNEIARHIGVSWEAVNRRLNPAYAKDVTERKRLSGTRKQRKRPGTHHYVDSGIRIPDAELQARLALIPPDTRNLTGRICGDPVYERSALFARRRNSYAVE